MKGYEIVYKTSDDSPTYVEVIGAESRKDARMKFANAKIFERVEIVSVSFIYNDINKDFYEKGDKRGWD